MLILLFLNYFKLLVPLSEALQPTAQALTLCQTVSRDALRSDRLSGLTS